MSIWFLKNTLLLLISKLRRASKLLLGTKIISLDFEDVLKNISNGDILFSWISLILFAHGNNGFIKYNSKIFAWHDQERLANTIQLIKDKGHTLSLQTQLSSCIDTLFSSKGVKTELSRFSVLVAKKQKER